MRQLRAVVVDVSGPEVRAGVHNDDPDRNGDGEAERARALQPVADDDALLVANLLEGLAGDAVEHPDQNRPEERAVDEVDSEAVAAEPHEVPVRQEILGARRENDSDNDDVESKSAVAAGCVGALGEQPLGGLHKLAGPGEPLRAISRVGS